MVEALEKLPAKQFVQDGELVILQDGHLSFDDLVLRIHLAERRIRTLSEETPASSLIFDPLVDERGKSLIELPLSERWGRLEELFRQFEKQKQIRLSPAVRDYKTAGNWLTGAWCQRIRWGGCETT